MTDSIYKIFRIAEWKTFQTQKCFTGNPHDKCDGFIHLCTFEQLIGTLSKHYRDDPQIILACFFEKAVQNLKWEVSRGNMKFPHLYGDLHYKDLIGYKDIQRNKNGAFTLSPFDKAET
ncbi:MAG: DUF952 domain-containing protein [Robiginitomaculum sp.]